jgi:hypothetical protein
VRPNHLLADNICCTILDKFEKKSNMFFPEAEKKGSDVNPCRPDRTPGQCFKSLFKIIGNC